MAVTHNIENVRRVVKRFRLGTRRKRLNAMLTDIGKLMVKNSRASMLHNRGNAPPHPTKLTSRTGRGEKSIDFETKVSGFRISGANVTVGSPVFYMNIHDQGLGRFPRRAVFEPGYKKSFHGIESIIERHMAGVVKTA